MYTFNFTTHHLVPGAFKATTNDFLWVRTGDIVELDGVQVRVVRNDADIVLLDNGQQMLYLAFSELTPRGESYLAHHLTPLKLTPLK